MEGYVKPLAAGKAELAPDRQKRHFAYTAEIDPGMTRDWDGFSKMVDRIACTTIHHLLPGRPGIRFALSARRAGGAVPPRPDRFPGLPQAGFCISLMVPRDTHVTPDHI